MCHSLDSLRFSRLCSRCGAELQPGDSYWYVNGETICAGCLEDFSREEWEPFRRVWGKEMIW